VTTPLGRPYDADVDGCDVDMTDPAHLTDDGEQVDALLMFADVQWDDPAAVEARRVELIELAAALHPDADSEPTTGAPDA
jgi:hypothetical protein